MLASKVERWDSDSTGKLSVDNSSDSVTSESALGLRLVLVAEMQRPQACKFLAVSAGVIGA